MLEKLIKERHKKSFNERYIPEPNTGCWLWTGYLNQNGYGETWVNNKKQKAHRVAYIIHRGPTNNLCVCHKCDTPACVNPDHLFLGTIQDNNNDMYAKKRNIKPECKRGHTLSADNVYVNPSGRRSCRACNLLHSRNRPKQKYYPRKKCKYGHPYDSPSMKNRKRVCRVCGDK